MRRLPVVAALALAAVVAGLRGAPVASSAAPDLVGWWNAANAGLLGITPAPPPGVPPDGLYVAGNPFAALPDVPIPRAPDNPLSRLADPTGGQQAISAVRWVLRPGERGGALRLTVAGPAPAPPTTVVAACPLTFGAFPPGGNQPWAQRPAYDCTVAEAHGVVSADGRAITFGLERFAPVDDVVAIALLPAGAADQVAFEAPGPDALTVTGGGATGAVDLPEDPVPPAAPGVAAPFAPPTPLTLPPSPPPVADGAPAGPVVTRPPSSGVAAGRTGGDGDDDDGRAVGVALALAFAAGLAHVARADTVAGGRSTAATRGVGRFARPRSGPPPTL